MQWWQRLLVLHCTLSFLLPVGSTHWAVASTSHHSSRLCAPISGPKQLPGTSFCENWQQKGEAVAQNKKPLPPPLCAWTVILQCCIQHGIGFGGYCFSAFRAFYLLDIRCKRGSRQQWWHWMPANKALLLASSAATATSVGWWRECWEPTIPFVERGESFPILLHTTAQEEDEGGKLGGQ